MTRIRALRIAPLSCLLFASSLSAQQLMGIEELEPEPIIETTAFMEKDTVEGGYINLANFPVRPMMIDPQNRLWALNHHDGTVRGFQVTGGPLPFAEYQVPWDPVSIAYWENDTDPLNPVDEILVVCAGTWTVVRLEMATGDFLGAVQLRQSTAFGNDGIGQMAEPADILVDPASDVAFVSCPAADSVIEIDLATSSVGRIFKDNGGSYDFRCKSPTFLSWDKSDPLHWKVLVAPMHSGNNTSAFTSTSGVDPSPQATGQKVIDLSDPAIATQGLPDEDLFRIDPVADTVTPLLTRTGTILFAHGVNPSTQDFWQLTVNANNADPNPQDEPGINGIFMDNQVQIVSNPFTAPTFAPPVDLDFASGDVVGQPNQLAFVTSDPTHLGKAFITGTLSDNVTVLNPDGSHYKTWAIQSASGRSIPRQTLLWDSPGFVENVALVYCWGSNEVHVYRWDVGANPTPAKIFNLGHDPTPADVARGREIFFDSTLSLRGDLSCASCHVEGGRDFLAWNLSNIPQDDKGPMATQTLVGIDRLEPFHWRGERDELKDFNGAFKGLLGADRELTIPEFEDFQAFVFSLRNPANKNQNRRRVVDETIVFDSRTAGSNACEGQRSYTDTVNPLFNGRVSCNTCHQMPTGTGNDVNADAPRSPRPSRSRLTPTPFNEIQDKQQPRVVVTYAPGVVGPGSLTRESALLGVGTSHGGVMSDLLAFERAVNGTPELVARDIVNFIHQWDQGLGQAAHYAYLLEFANVLTDSTSELTGYLLAQAQNGNCGMAVIGQAENPATSTLQAVNWYWDRDNTSFANFPGAFVADTPGFAPRTIRDFRSGAYNDGEHHLFLGLPKGMAEPFAVDCDMDGFTDRDPLETAVHDPALPGSAAGTQPVFTVTPDKRWVTTHVARVTFATNEATTAKVRYRESGTSDPWQHADSEVLAKCHAVVLTGLRPSTKSSSLGSPNGAGGGVQSELVTYEVEVTVSDAETVPQANMSTFTFDTDPFIEPDVGFCVDFTGLCSYVPLDRINQEEHLISSLAMQPLQALSGGVIRAVVDAEVIYKRGPRANPGARERIVIGRPLMKPCASMDPCDCGLVVAIPDAMWSAGPGSVKVPGDVIATGPLGGDPRPLNAGGQLYSGPFLVTKVPTLLDGTTDIQFDVVMPASGARLIFDVDAVLEIWDVAQFDAAVLAVETGASLDLSVAAEAGGAWEGWNFPNTGEDNSSATSDQVP